MLRLGQVADIVGINLILRAGEIGLDAASAHIAVGLGRPQAWLRARGRRALRRHRTADPLAHGRVDDLLGHAEASAPMFGVTAEEGLPSSAVLADGRPDL
ncbi:MAG: hypothetical protein U0W40_16835 [Acidimicrobiia bacterium]